MDIRDKWGIEHSQELHKKKLKLISSHTSDRIDNSSPVSLKFSKTRLAACRTYRNQEFKQIFKKNQVILEALNEISNRKAKLVQQQIHPVVKSLNQNYRTKVVKKILAENEHLLQKLSSKEATISLKKFDEDFQLSLKYKKNLSKSSACESQKNILERKRLPKIEYQKKNPKSGASPLIKEPGTKENKQKGEGKKSDILEEESAFSNENELFGEGKIKEMKEEDKEDSKEAKAKSEDSQQNIEPVSGLQNPRIVNR